MKNISKNPDPAANIHHQPGLPPPIHTLEQSKALLTAYHHDLVIQRRISRAKAFPLQDRSRALALDHLRAGEFELKVIESERRKAISQRIQDSAQFKLHPTTLSVRDMELFDSSDLTLKVPPYDFSWISNTHEGVEHADHIAGTYDLAVQSLGDGESSVAAGIGFWFFSGNGNPAQRFAAVVDYFDDWWDSADWYVAHNNGHTRLWVFGASEQAWVAQSEQTPSWNDGVGWLEEHGNDPGGEDGRVACETYFNAAPNSWYQCWLWSSAEVYSDSGFFGVSASSIHMNISAPLAVIGRLA